MFANSCDVCCGMHFLHLLQLVHLLRHSFYALSLSWFFYGQAGSEGEEWLLGNCQFPIYIMFLKYLISK